VSATPRFGPLDIAGDIAVSSTDTSVRSDVEALGFDEDEAVFSPRADFSWGPAHVMASGYIASYDGTGRAETDLDLGGVLIRAGDEVDSDLDVQSASLTVTFDFIPTELLDIGLGVGVRYVGFDGRISSVSTTESISSDEAFVLPTLAGRVAVGVGPFDFSVIGSGIAAEANGIEAAFADVDAMIEYSFDRWLNFHGGIVVGYRYIMMDVEFEDRGSDIEADLDFQGFFLGLTLGV
jgi:hypothetical protein